MTTLWPTQAGAQAQPEARRPMPPQVPVNVSPRERAISAAVGSLLALNAMRRPSGLNLLLGVLGGATLYRALTGYCPAYKALGINPNRLGQAAPGDFFDRGIHVQAAITIDQPSDALYRFWHDFENLPRFMRHLESVRRLDDRRSHWKAKAPAGATVEWHAEIINDEPDHLIAWRSLGGADVDNAGSVRFIPAPGGRGTEVHVVVEYIPPAGRLGSTVARLFGEEPQQQIQDDLRHLKQIIETRELPSTQGQPMGSCGR